MERNWSSNQKQPDTSLNASADKPQSRISQGRRVKIVILVVISVSLVLQGLAFPGKSSFLYPFRIFEDLSSNKYYNVLIFGTREHLSQRIDFLEEVKGVWKAEFSCAKGTSVVLSVGKNKTDFMDKDAVVFNIDEPAVVQKIAMLVSMQPSPKQAWVYYGRESAVRTRWLFKAYSGSLPLHGVWSYHRDAEVHTPYGYFVAKGPASNDSQSDTDRWLRGKSKLVAWIVRNCYNTFWPRTAYVENLRKHISIDIYGSCGPLVCPFQPRSDCVTILKQYKFYLALESAECDDYATEKLWETAYTNGIVPVVYGAQREFYAKEAPPDSFIFAGDFSSTKQLAEFLLHLDKNPIQYAKYFDWRRKGRIEIPKLADRSLHPEYFCPLVPFIAKVAGGNVAKKPLCEFPYYTSCVVLRGRDVRHRPGTRRRLRHWKPRNY
ncbi:galactoside 3(4)-L-fucosyltransferase-like [Acanthaster planci]|uniref:Fucosyltransferase n=1 Tax=Acanthaster planci TaxID=133434 RepID=A0A8B7XPV5_ACAPL|nr:galactoside 3(4)-L-fucosyltransferase-like [Acanthaster planci]